MFLHSSSVRTQAKHLESMSINYAHGWGHIKRRLWLCVYLYISSCVPVVACDTGVCVESFFDW